MASKRTAAILTIIGGVFYIIGGAVLAGLVGLVGSLGSGLTGLSGSGSQSVCSFFPGFPCDSNASISGLGGISTGGLNLGVIADILLVVGVVTGGLIIFGGWLINSESAGRRKIGAVIAIVMILIGGLTTFGGLVIGFILAAIGVYLGLTYKSGSSRMTIPLGPMASVTLGPQISTGTTTNAPAGSGPLNYCIKCGSQVRQGAVFCGACGARLVD